MEKAFYFTELHAIDRQLDSFETEKKAGRSGLSFFAFVRIW